MQNLQDVRHTKHKKQRLRGVTARKKGRDLRMARRNLCLDFPEIAACDQVFSRYLGKEMRPEYEVKVTSESIQCLLKSINFDFGHQSNHRSLAETQDHHYVAIVGGKTSNELALLPVFFEEVGWNASGEGTKLLCPKFEVPPDCWINVGAEVLRLEFSFASDTVPLCMGICQARGTTIYWPLWDQTHPSLNTEPNNGAMDHELDMLSFLNPSEILQPGQSSRHPHIDFRFNPWRADCFAVLEASGNWSVWHLMVSKDSRRTNVRNKLGQDFMMFRMGQIEGWSASESDAWGCLHWIRLKVLIACYRTDVWIIEFNSTTTSCHKWQNLPLSLGGKIWDMVSDPVEKGQVFMSTTNHIFWIRFDMHGPDYFQVILSWRHVRANSRQPLRLKAHSSTNFRYIFLFSNTDDLMLLYQCHENLSLGPQVHVTDASSFAERKGKRLERNPGDELRGTYDVTLVPLEYTEDESQLDGPGRVYKERKIRFLGVTTLHKEFGLQREIHYYRDGETATETTTTASHEFANFHSLDHEAGVRPPRYMDTGLHSGNLGIAEPLKETSAIEAFATKALDLGATLRNLHARNIIGAGRWKATEWFREKLNYDAFSSSNGSDWMSRLKEALNYYPMLGSDTTKIGADLQGSLLTTYDVESLSSSLTTLLEGVQGGGLTIVTPLIGPFLRTTRFSEIPPPNSDYSATYDFISSLWIHKVPEKFPRSTRLKLEKEAQRVALDIYLASIGLRVPRPDSELEKPTGIPQSLAIPRFSTQPGSQLLTQASQLDLTVPSNASAAHKIEAAVARLRNYTTVTAPSTEGHYLSSIIDHWAVELDPETYDWEGTKRRLEEENREKKEEDERTKKKRLRLERSRKAFEDAQVLRAPAVQSSQALLAQTQPTQPSSQPADHAMTQVERGPHGGRDQRPKKKAKARPGFR
ncbi:MAG: hypothetical protein M1814_000764 [Vezdaea aestivalis]|nr:MAG: hypothetical protein M1814_000764 [Vezdaea aestivalis]